MRIVKVTDPQALKMASETLTGGGLLVYPTDTAYGLGANALDHHAVAKMYDLRDRPHEQPTHIVVSSIEEALEYVEFTEKAMLLAKRFWPGPLTMVLKKIGKVYNTPEGDRNTLAIRIPNFKFTLDLSASVNFPITTPSANVRGGGTPYKIEEVLASFGKNVEEIDVIVDAGELAKQEPSTFVDMTVEPPDVIREGPISRDETFKVIG